MKNREPIYAALFAIANGIPGLATVSRTFRFATDVPPAQQPALIQTQAQQAAHVVERLPTRWTLHAVWWLYVHKESATGDYTVQTLNALVDACEAALAIPPGFDEQTLGGLVVRARVAGTIETDEGLMLDQAVARIPIEIIAT